MNSLRRRRRIGDPRIDSGWQQGDDQGGRRSRRTGQPAIADITSRSIEQTRRSSSHMLMNAAGSLAERHLAILWVGKIDEARPLISRIALNCSSRFFGLYGGESPESVRQALAHRMENFLVSRWLRNLVNGLPDRRHDQLLIAGTAAPTRPVSPRATARRSCPRPARCSIGFSPAAATISLSCSGIAVRVRPSRQSSHLPCEESAPPAIVSHAVQRL